MGSDDLDVVPKKLRHEISTSSATLVKGALTRWVQNRGIPVLRTRSMATTAELNPEEGLSSAAIAADSDSPESTGAEVGQAPPPPVSEPEALHEPKATAQAGEAVRAEPAGPKLDLISFFPLSERAPRIEPAPPKAPRNFVAPGIVAGFALLILGAGAGYEQMHQSALLAAQIRRNEHLVSTVSNLTERLDAIEAGRAREETVDVRKLLGEMKLGASATRDVSGAVSQLTARVDHVERDQGARLDKLVERIDRDALSPFADLAARLDKLEKKAASPTVAAVPPDRDASSRLADLAARLDKFEKKAASPPVAAVPPDRDASSRLADLAARLDKLEKKAASPTVAAVAPDHEASSRFADLATRLDKLEKKAASPTVVAVASVPRALPPKPIPTPTPAKVDPGVSSETTASIEKPRPPLRGYAVIGIGDGFATIRGREGEISVGAGDMIPGLGRVLRIARHGREWLVVTSVGVISGEGGPY